jgi:drug/metabolite transporter (DMT)-like permease
MDRLHEMPFLLGTLSFTVYGQLIIKARSARHAAEPSGGTEGYLRAMLLDPFVLSGLLAAGFAAICWILAVRQLPLAFAYPMMALTFVLVPLGASILFDEPLSLVRSAGLALIVAGVAINALAS